jgi:flagellar motor switch protein FliM
MSATGEQLTPEQIAELVEAAKQGKLPEEAPSAPKRRARRMHTVDFSRPTKFNTDHLRRISRAIESFCHTASTRMSADLRTPVEMEPINTVQLTWSAAQGQLPSNAVAMTVDVKPLGTRMLLVAELSLVLSALEHLLGGTTDGPVIERHLSEIDWALTRRWLESFITQFSPLWHDMAGVELEGGELDLRSEQSPIAAPADPALAALIEVRVNRQSGMLGLLVPWAAIDPVGDKISGKESDSELRNPADAAAVASALATARVTLRAEVASTLLSVEDVLRLEPGAVVRLGKRAEEGAVLYVEQTPLRRAQPGRSGRWRAVKVEPEGAR